MTELFHPTCRFCGNVFKTYAQGDVCGRDACQEALRFTERVKDNAPEIKRRQDEAMRQGESGRRLKASAKKADRGA